MQLPMTCKECGGSCCKQRISFTIDEWDDLRKYFDLDQLKAKRFTFMGFGDEGYWYSLELGACPALTATGCAIPYAERPLKCKLSPYVAFPIHGDEGVVYSDLYLATLQCPAWRELGELREVAEEELRNATRKED